MLHFANLRSLAAFASKRDGLLRDARVVASCDCLSAYFSFLRRPHYFVSNNRRSYRQIIVDLLG